MSSTNRRNLTILSFSLVVVTLGFGMVIPIFPFYIEKLGASGSDLGLLIATAALLEFLFAPIWGSISDRTGRKPILMIGMVGYGLSSLLFGLSSQLWMLYASRALSGLLSSATASTAMATISDSTSEEDRGGGIGMLGAAMGLGLILGPGLGGWLGSGSLAMPFFISAGLALVALLLILALLPESLSAEARQRAQVRTIQFGDLWRALFGPIGILLALLFLVSFGLTNFEAVFGLYAAEKLGYGPDRVGVILVVVGVASTLGKAVFIGPAIRRWGEAIIVKASTLASSVGFVVLLLAHSYPAVLLATGLFILSKTFLRTVLLSLASKRATLRQPQGSSLRQAQDRTAGQGVVMGLGNSFISLGRIVGPIWAGFIFDVNLSYPYLSGAAIMFIGFLVGLGWISQKGRRTTEGWQSAAR
jgi:DHA1 family multidrug resistance protein-like MFS transporter